jgi:hypothetical protein
MVIGKELVAIREEQDFLIKTILNLIGNVWMRIHPTETLNKNPTDDNNNYSTVSSSGCYSNMDSSNQSRTMSTKVYGYGWWCDSILWNNLSRTWCAMVIKGIIILQFILVGCTTTSCPKKYMDSNNIKQYCELDYGGKFILNQDYSKWEELVNRQYNIN